MNVWPGLNSTLWILETLVKSTFVMAGAGLLAFGVRRRPPTVSHLVWALAFSAVIALPLVSPIVPGSTFVTINTTVLSTPSKQSQANQLPQEGTQNVTIPGGPLASQASSQQLQPVGSRLHGLLLYPKWLNYLAGLWFIGFLAIASRTIFGLHCLRIVRKYGTRPISSEELAERLDVLAERAGVRRSWSLRISATHELTLPMTWGVIRPTIVLPMDAELWPLKQFEAVMLHELAHVRRYDFLSQLLAEIVCSAYWFNPIVWLGARAMRSDAELAADEAVLQTGLKPSEYASELLHLAAKLGTKKQAFAYVGTPAMNNSKIETRLKSVLKYPAGRRGMSSVQVLSACIAAIVFIPVFAGLHAGTEGSSQQDQASGTDQPSAKTRLKQVALESLMYAQDYDGYYPYVQQTASAVEVMMPYARTRAIFESPTPGGHFLFNMNLAGVSITTVREPTATPLWWEKIDKSTDPLNVAFSDGHVKQIDQATLKTNLGWKFERKANMKPLPIDYLVPKKS